MMLAVSSIAWPEGRDAEAAAALAAAGVRAVEIAPRKVWPDPSRVSDAEIAGHRRWWADRGFEIVAAQALLFGRPDLTIFQDAATRGQTLEFLRGVIRTCAGLGARSLVFGAPKNRLIAPRSAAEVRAEAVDFFSALAGHAESCGTVIGLEANPPRYGCDYITSAADAIALVEAVNRPGLRWHVDTACMTLAGDDIAGLIARHVGLACHVHLSESDLSPFGAGSVDHAAFAATLEAAGYARTIAIEMRSVDPFTPSALADAVEKARAIYGRLVDRSAVAP